MQDIKRDLALSDTQLGLLSGIAFAFFYAVMGIPIARWADVGNRVSIIAVCTTFWSGAVALCGAAAGFWQLMLMRMGVAVGEAGGYAPSLSLISDHFARSERVRGVARFMLGVPLAMIIGYLAAGWFNELYGWRWTFFLFGLPGFDARAAGLVHVERSPGSACNSVRADRGWLGAFPDLTRRSEQYA